ncbi:MAG: choice-of-anchor D domain-containing protein, partial [Rubrivivax sp.]|nr:choice-of-anchor D domain-containing protein [Rubrivivax sp.]
AGALAPMSGQVINLRSTYENIADQKLNIVLASGAAAYNAAVGSTVTPVQVANQRVGGTNSATLAISNTAAPGSFSEDLNASIASQGGQASASGSVNGRVAGTGNTGTGAITVGVDTATAGAMTGVVNLNYQSTGTVNGVSNGLAAIGVGGQTVTVNGNVYQAASGQLLSAPLNFGTVQVGQTVFRDIVVRNNASGAAGFVEDLNVAFGAKSGSGTALFDGTGSLAGILAGATSNAGNGTMRVNVNTANAGTINGSIAINYTSAGAVGGVSNGLGTLAVGSDSLGVAGTIDAQANVVNQASPQFGTTSVNLGSVRVGATAPTASIQLSNQSVGAPQAALSATIASNGAPVTASGAVNLLDPGASSSALQVGLNTAVAGNFTGANAGSATVSLVSDASNEGNCVPNCALNLPSQQISVQGKVYTTAVGQAGGGPIDFGIVRVGDTVSARNITITNAAAASALNDTLRASGTGLSGPVTLGSAVSGLGAGASGNLAVMLSTASAGTVNQTAQVSFLSQNPDMADVSAGPDASVQVMATINNLANADFDLLSSLGSLSDDGNGHYVLNLGTLNLGDARTLLLQLDNDVSGPADRLRGSFSLAGVDDFSLGGFGDVSDLAGGAVQGGLTVGFTASAVGLYSDTVDFSGRSFNASDTQGLAQTRSLRIVANVVDPNGGGTVSEPGTLALVLGAALLAARRRRAR